MDNDDLRRGRATTHKVYDEAIALLVGDSLLSDAFSLISKSEEDLDPRVQIRLVCEFSQAIGGEVWFLDKAWTCTGQVEKIIVSLIWIRFIA